MRRENEKRGGEALLEFRTSDSCVGARHVVGVYIERSSFFFLGGVV